MTSRSQVLVAAEIALVALTVAVVISLERLFTDLSFLSDVLLMALGSHLIAGVCRRAEISMALATPISGLSMVVLGTAIFYPDASALIIPTPETVDALGADLRDAWSVFSDDAAPVPPLRGFVVTTSVLVWYGVFLADWAAFRLRSPLEAVAPATAVFVFASLLGVDRNSIAHGTLFAAGVGAVLLAMRMERQVREEVWVADSAGRGISTTARVGLIAGACAVLLGAAAAPQLPGADGDPLVDVTDLDNGPQTRSVISPLVEVSTSLVNQSDEEMFSVQVPRDQQDYWRLMALTEFRDEIWRRSSNFDEVTGPVGANTDTRVTTRSVIQEITIQALGNIYLPAAYEVTNVLDDGDITLEYEVATGALVVERGRDDVPRGHTYTIESAVPVFTPDQLPADATAGLPGGFISEHTQLPADCAPGERTADTGCWPTAITSLAEQITAGLTTDYDRARALQDYFLDPAVFTYDLEIGLDFEHDIDDMEEFVFDVRSGYCEQFASTFAAMARSIGIPARVAVGFTPGDWDPNRNEYVVSGKHAHAWPEVYFADTGWILFDPTPGRSRGFDNAITGVDRPQQQGDVAPPADDTTTTTTTPDTTTTEAPGGSGGGDDTPDPTTAPDEADADAPITAVPIADADDGRGPWPFVIGFLAVLAVVAFVPTVHTIRRRARLAAVASDPVGRGELAWDDALGAVRLLGFAPTRGQTPHEFATTLERSTRDLGPLRELADHVTNLRFAEGDDAVHRAIAAQEASAQVVERCKALAGAGVRWREALDPRSLVGPPPAPLF